MLAAESDGETAQQAQALKRDLSWLNDRTTEVKSNRLGIGEFSVSKPSLDAREWNSALLGSRSTLAEMLKKLA
jgi:hypothetical protein